MKFLKGIGLALATVCLCGLTACDFGLLREEQTKTPNNTVTRPSTGNGNSSTEKPSVSGDYVRVKTRTTEGYSSWFDIQWTGGEEYIKKGVEITATVSFACNAAGEILAPVSDTYDGLIIITDGNGDFLEDTEQTEEGWSQKFMQGGANGENKHPATGIFWKYTFSVPTEFKGDSILITFAPAINGSLAEPKA